MPDTGSSTISLVVLAGLLSFLPVTVLFWVYYLREREPTVRGSIIARFLATGMAAVLPAVLLERLVFRFSQVHPTTASAFFSEYINLETPTDLFLAFLVAFGVVALVEEGFRYLLLRLVLARTTEVDQIADGVQIGIASGLGFAFIENALYFLRLFRSLDFDTLAVVFFLRFLVSTFGHMSFGGIMGYCLVRSLADPVRRRVYHLRALAIPWAIHGLFDFLLTIQLSAYTVIFLLLPIAALWRLYRLPTFHERFRIGGQFLRAPAHGHPRTLLPWHRPPIEALPFFPRCPTCVADLPETALRCGSCGTRFHRKRPASVLPSAALPGAGATAS